MNAYIIIYPRNCSDPESHNAMWENIGEMSFRYLNDSVILILSELAEPAFCARVFNGVSASYRATAFRISTSTATPANVAG